MLKKQHVDKGMNLMIGSSQSFFLSLNFLHSDIALHALHWGHLALKLLFLRVFIPCLWVKDLHMKEETHCNN